MTQEDFSLFGSDLFGEPIRQTKSGPLAQRFEFPPFSVLSAREGAWQERKRAWLACGIRSEVGRTATCYQIGDKAAWDASRDGSTKTGEGKGTSVFDPVLCELAYRWFCPDGGQIVDPFAGGSVRGIVAALMGFRYWGCDLRPEQVAANYEQANAICPTAVGADSLYWAAGDSMAELDRAPAADFVFSCPPYGDLERYSDDPRDLSTMEYETFMPAYKRIILRCSKVLKPGRLACFVVGDFRDARGNYRGFVADTINAFRECGMPLYNDAILVTCVGSLPVRAGKQFTVSRKLGKTHQNVLVFHKPDNGRPYRWNQGATEATGGRENVR